MIFGYMSARVYSSFNILLLYAKECDISLHVSEGLFVCVEVLRPSQPNGGHVERGQFT